MKKTALEWFEQLPEPIRTQAMANSKRPEECYSSLSDCLDCNFNWQKSKQGLEYWFDISNRSYKGEFDQPAPNLNGWIPVGERLPEEGGENYLVIINGAVTIDLFRADHKKFHNEIHNSIDKLTHWQPLPKLPEVKL